MQVNLIESIYNYKLYIRFGGLVKFFILLLLKFLIIQNYEKDYSWSYSIRSRIILQC